MVDVRSRRPYPTDHSAAEFHLSPPRHSRLSIANGFGIWVSDIIRHRLVRAPAMTDKLNLVSANTDLPVRSIRQWLSDNNIDEIEAVVPDMTGIARGKLIPAHKYSEEVGMRLPEAIFLQTVTGEYPEDESAIDPAERDIFLKPDLNSFRLVPWAEEPTALVIHDCFYADGTPVEMSPRYVLKKILDAYNERGWKPIVAPELEFYLVKPNHDADYPLEPPVGRSGRAEPGRQSFGILLPTFFIIFIANSCTLAGIL